MAAVIKSFGGVYPGLKARALPGDAAQTAHNLLASVPDFRPLSNDTVVAAGQAPSNAQTLYRLARVAGGGYNTNMAINWILKAGPVSFAKGPLNSDTTERTYYSFDDGSAPPRWLDTTPADRLLGVPAPTVVPGTAVVAGDEFTPDERSSAIDAALEAVANAITSSMFAVWRGAPEPGSGTNGWINYQDIGTATATQGYQARVYRMSSLNQANNGILSNSYTPYDLDKFTWIQDATLHGFWATSNASSPAWQGGSPGNYYDHICFAVRSYGLTYNLDSVGFRTLMNAIPMPGAPASPFFTPTQITALIARLDSYMISTGDVIRPKIEALANKHKEIRTLMDGGIQSTTVAQVTAFYAKAEIVLIFENELNAWAAGVFDACTQAFNTTSGAGSYQPGDGGAP